MSMVVAMQPVTPGVHISFDQQEENVRPEVCVVCGGIALYWYVTAYTPEGDFYDSALLFSCFDCGQLFWPTWLDYGKLEDF